MLFSLFLQCVLNKASFSQFFYPQEAIATSEELGRDLEHVEVLQKKFDDFMKDLQANESRVTYINDLAHQLGDEGHPDIELISTKQAVSPHSV